MQIKDILSEIEKVAPLPLQEDYDNCGIQCGNAQNELKGILLTLDVTESVLQEALENNCNLILAHHPLIFSGLKKITGQNYTERVLITAIKHDITIYAAHTNLDNIKTGVNKKIADKIGLEQLRILRPLKGKLIKLFTYAPKEYAENILNALYAAGAGNIGEYSDCSFQVQGIGSFRPSANTKPFIGKAGGSKETAEEIKIEVLLPDYLQDEIVTALKNAHPYEAVAYELIRLENFHQDIGAGMIGKLPQPIKTVEFFEHLKKTMNLIAFKYTNPHKEMIETVALCGGSGSFLLKEAIRQKADIFITADFKYHQFFDAENKIIIADIGHYESECYTQEIFSKILNEKFPNFAVRLSKINTNPVNYYF